MDFKEIKNLSNSPEGNIDNITTSMLLSYKDSYANNLKKNTKLENNNINIKIDNIVSKD